MIMPTRIGLIGLVFLFLISCSKDKDTWVIAKTNDDILSYTYYLDHHRNGVYVESANYRIDSITTANQNMKPPVFDVVSSPIKLWDNKVIDEISLELKITAKQSEEYASDSEIDTYTYIQDVLGKTGVTILPQGKICKNRMNVNLQLVALTGNYSGLGKLYTGNLIKGYMRFSNNKNNPIQTDVFKENPCEFNISYTEQTKQMKIFLYKEPFNQLKRISIKRQINDFIYKVWGAAPLLWYERGRFIDYPEFGYDYDGTYSEDFVHNINRACFSDNQNIRERAMRIMTWKKFPFDPEFALTVVKYTTAKYDFETNYSQSKMKSLFPIINKLGKDAIEVTPILIEYVDERQKEEWSMKDMERLLGSIEEVTGINFKDDMQGMRKWWFENKQILIEK